MFTIDLPKNEEPLDRTSINQVLLYFGDDEVAEFKRLCKTGMQDLLPDYKNGNVSDFLLTLLRKHYGTKNNA